MKQPGVKYITRVERTLYIAKCTCGNSYEYIENPPKARQCSCGKIVDVEKQTFTSDEYKGA